MVITKQDRAAAYEIISDALRRIYESPEAGAHYYAAFLKSGLPETDYKSYITLIGDTILGFYTIANMAQLFQTELGLGADQAQRLTSDLLEFLGPVVEREEEQANAKKQQGLDLAAQIEATHTQRTPEQTPSEEITNVAPKPTIGNPDRIHGYGAYREQYRYGEEPEKSDVIKTASQEDLLRQNSKD